MFLFSFLNAKIRIFFSICKFSNDFFYDYEAT